VRHIRLPAGQKLTGTHVAVPGDPSSAAFPLVAGLIVPGSEVTVEGVMLNELRTGLFTTLQEMGADLVISNVRDSSGEQVGDITARYSPNMKGVVVPPERAPAMIDEYPILAVAAAFAEGETVMRGIGEMRVKESDRIALTAAGLQACGVMVEEEPEGMIVVGTGGQSSGARRRPGPHPRRSPHRHEPPDPRHGRPAAVSSRRARHDRHQLPRLRRHDARPGRRSGRGLTMGFVIAVDGPAASGKGTIANRLAALYGYPVLDTGLLYRGVGVKLLPSCGGDLDDATAATAAALRPGTGRTGAARASHPRRGRAGQPRRGAYAVRLALRDFQLRLRGPGARRGDRRPRHRHGDRPRGAGQAVRHRQRRGPRRPPLEAAGRPGRGVTFDEILADILRATSATAAARTRP
jgi:hypothetical protein